MASRCWGGAGRYTNLCFGAFDIVNVFRYDIRYAKLSWRAKTASYLGFFGCIFIRDTLFNPVQLCIFRVLFNPVRYQRSYNGSCNGSCSIVPPIPHPIFRNILDPLTNR
jgi:hypothetical protein